ncbi:MAG: hypothetical protein ABIO35_08250 [Nitrobacter sp.]
MGDRAYDFDANLILSDQVAAYTADGFLQVSGANAVINIGGNQSTSPTQQARTEFAVVVEISAIDVASTNETYQLKIIGNNTGNFADGTGVVLGMLEFGDGPTRIPVNALVDTTIGEYEMFFTNEQGGTKYQYAAAFLDVGGTTPSITFTSVYAAPMPGA